MANRTIQQKMLKMKRRGRYAKLSGGQTRGLSRDVQVLEHDGEDRVRVKNVSVFVGPASLSKQVVNTGRGPDAERMQEYYQRLHSFDQSLPETLGLTAPMRQLQENYKRIVDETRNSRIRLLDDTLASLDLFYEKLSCQWFFVEVNKQKNFIRRSTVYSSKKYALLFLGMKKITWVEQLPK